jgi:hypothetical protein
MRSCDLNATLVADMVARAVEHASTRLHDLRHEEWEDWGVAAAAFALGLLAVRLRPEFAVPLLVGAIALTCRGVLAEWRRWDLLDSLAGEPDAYVIPEVLARAETTATMASRCNLARTIRWRLEEIANPQVEAAADDLRALAAELEDEQLELEPACAVACSKLLTDAMTSPLLNPALPIDEVRSRVLQVRRGFHPRI